MMRKTFAGLVMMATFLAGTGNALALEPVQLEINPEALKLVHKSWCEKIQKKVKEKSETIEENQASHLERYNKLKGRLDTLIERLAAAGYDTAQLEKDMDTLSEKIKKFSADYETFKDETDEAKAYVCDKTKAEFQAKLSETRAALKTLQKDAKDIKDFYKNEIKPDIRDVKSQKK